MKTSELTGAALDWAVTLIEGPEACGYGVADWREQRACKYVYRWHQSWAQSGPIIEQEEIQTRKCGVSTWLAELDLDEGDFMRCQTTGPTPLIAAMRCYVASVLGDDVEIPEELK